MINVSDDFKNAMKAPIKELRAYIRLDNNEITSSDDLISFKINAECDMCKTAMRKVEIKLISDYFFVGEWVHVGFGVKITNTTTSWEYLDFGSFLITEATYTKDKDTTTLVGYDLMIKAMTQYQPLAIEYPIGLYNYTQKLCEACGLTLLNDSFDTHNDWPITQDLWQNIDGITYRDIFAEIAKVTGTTCIISSDKVYFKSLTDTYETLTYDNLKKLKLEDKYGEINSVVLARVPQEDNIYMRDDASIEANGLTEFRIENNEIIDKDRDNAMTPIYNKLHGINYYPFETNTEGLGWYEIGDKFDIINEQGTYNCVLFNFTLEITGGIKETLKTSAQTKTQTQYQYATTIAKRVKNTEIITDKQGQQITAIVSDMYDENGMIQENFSKVFQDISNIIASVQNSGGSNLLLNSVMFAYDNEGKPNEWNVTGDGTLDISSSTESLTAGCLSGHIFTLNNKKVSQTVRVKQDDPSVSEKTYYSFSCKVKKNITGTAYVKIYNSNETYIQEFASGEDAYYSEVTFKELLPKDTYYTIELYGSADSDATFTDCMLAVGNYASQWQQASGEVMNTQVNINTNGILVKSSVYAGDYTVMSPLEFAGYSNINGTVTKIFTLNKDTTEVMKLKATDEISMPPIKIVPITTGDTQGWAFVATSKEV